MLNWGLMGAGGIARVFCNGMRFSKTGRITAVASCSKKRGHELARVFAISKQYEDYESLLADDQIDAVYINTIHPFHVEWVIKAASAGKQQYENIKLKLFYQVKNAYYEYYYVTRAISVIKENVQLLEYLESVIRTKYRTGQAAHADLIKVQVELDKLQDWLKSTEEMVRPVTAQLNAALNRPSSEPLPVPGKIRENITAPDYSQLVNWLKSSNPELKAIDHLAAKETIGIKLAKKNYFPDFSIGVDYVLTGKSLMPGVMESGKDPLIAMMTINLPIRFKKIKASIREARARLNSVLNEKEEKENNLLARLEMVYYQFHDSGRKLALYNDALIPRAKQALEVTQAAFEAGKVDFLNLIDSQRTLLGFELAYERALATHAQRLAELEMVVGKEL